MSRYYYLLFATCLLLPNVNDTAKIVVVFIYVRKKWLQKIKGKKMLKGMISADQNDNRAPPTRESIFISFLSPNNTYVKTRSKLRLKPCSRQSKSESDSLSDSGMNFFRSKNRYSFPQNVNVKLSYQFEATSLYRFRALWIDLKIAKPFCRNWNKKKCRRKFV